MKPLNETPSMPTPAAPAPETSNPRSGRRELRRAPPCFPATTTRTTTVSASTTWRRPTREAGGAANGDLGSGPSRARSHGTHGEPPTRADKILQTTRQHSSQLTQRYDPLLCTAGSGTVPCHSRATKGGQRRSTGVTPDRGWPQVKAWVRARNRVQSSLPDTGASVADATGYHFLAPFCDTPTR